MKFLSSIIIAISPLVALARPLPSGSSATSEKPTVTFRTLDNKVRTLVFTANEGTGFPNKSPVKVHPGIDHVEVFPIGWVGNWYAVPEGGDINRPGMLGEVAFNGWDNLHYFDVSAIVNPDDKSNVKMLYPRRDPYTPRSGCESFPCGDAYYLPDDLQTRATTHPHLVCTLGVGRSFTKDTPFDAPNTPILLHEPESVDDGAVGVETGVGPVISPRETHYDDLPRFPRVFVETKFTL